MTFRQIHSVLGPHLRLRLGILFSTSSTPTLFVFYFYNTTSLLGKLPVSRRSWEVRSFTMFRPTNLIFFIVAGYLESALELAVISNASCKNYLTDEMLRNFLECKADESKERVALSTIETMITIVDSFSTTLWKSFMHAFESSKGVQQLPLSCARHGNLNTLKCWFKCILSARSEPNILSRMNVF